MLYPEKCLSESLISFNCFMNINELLEQIENETKFIVLGPFTTSFESLRLKNRT